MKIKLEFSGGVELLFGNQTHLEVDVPAPDGKPLTARALISWAHASLVQERPELFVKGDSVRPGILVLVNGCDWELSGSLDTELHEGDEVTFISTLHGG